MENEEKEDLLLDITEESESDVSDYYIQEKILQILEKDKCNKSKLLSRNVIVLTACFIFFISSTVLLIVFPVYIHQANRSGLQTYSKLFAFTTANLVIFATLGIFARRLQKWNIMQCSPSMNLYMCLPNHLKASFLLSIGSLLVFLLVDENLVSCHLQDPLKGCVIVFSLMFYFIFSRRRTSVERVFCSITVIVGTFVTVDFGLCNKFRCRGAELTEQLPAAHTWHMVYVLAYLLALAAYALHWTYLENFCRSSSCSSSLDMSIVSKGTETTAVPLPNTRSLSIISGAPPSRVRGNPDPLNVSLTDSVRPITSTPNENDEQWHWGPCDWLAAHHISAWLFVCLCCWVPTIYNIDKKPKLLVNVFENVLSSLSCHLGSSLLCQELLVSFAVLLVSHVAFSVSGLVILLRTRSAVTVSCLMMNALPMSALFWSVYQFDASAIEPVSFKWSITGEAVSAMLGFPIVGVGTFLLLKSHITNPPLDLRLT